MSIIGAKKGMISKIIAKEWDEAFPTGNGTIGALIMGDPLDATIIFNHEELFLPLPVNDSSDIPDMAKYLPQLRKIIREGRYKEAAEFYIDKMVEKGFPKELVWTDPFHPAFDLKLHIPQDGKIRDYVRTVDFETGEVEIRWCDNRGQFIQRLFVSRVDNIAVLSIKNDSNRNFDCMLKLDEHPGKKHIKDTVLDAEDTWITFQSIYEVGTGGYDGVAKVVDKGGTPKKIGRGIKVKDTNEVLVAVGIAPFKDSNGRQINVLKDKMSQIPDDYQRLFSNHADIHREMFNRISFDLNCGQDRDLTNEELIKIANEGHVPNALIERLFHFGRYVLISSSGQLPPNLQGVWNGSWEPPWSSDYTLDENLQMMMWQVFPGNLPEAAHSYFNLIESYVQDWKENARKYYGCRGIMSCSRSSRNGLNKHFSVEYPLFFWTAGAGWLGQMFYDYWLFTGDRDFLEKRTVPYLKEVALFYEDFLVENENGRLEFIPSYSPENTPANTDNPTSINATMDIAVAKEVLTNLIAACKELGIEAENIEKWQKMLEKLPEYMVNSDGAIKEWAYPGLEDNYRHRHSSHLYPVFPGFEFTEEETPELYKACLRAAELRLTDGIEAITGWGLAHLANSSARLKEGELAYKALCRIARLFLLPNLFTCHNYGHLFQLDANMGFTAALMEMLVFSRPGWVELLPAMPHKLAKGKIKGLMCRGGVKIENLEWDMEKRMIEFSFTASKTGTIVLKLPAALDSYSKESDAFQLEPIGEDKKRHALFLQAGRSVGASLRLK